MEKITFIKEILQKFQEKNIRDNSRQIHAAARSSISQKTDQKQIYGNMKNKGPI